MHEFIKFVLQAAAKQHGAKITVSVSTKEGEGNGTSDGGKGI